MIKGKSQRESTTDHHEKNLYIYNKKKKKTH